MFFISHQTVRTGIVCLLCAGFSIFSTGCSKEEALVTEPAVKPVKVLTIGEREEGAQRALPGTVVAGEKGELGFRVAGQITEFLVKEGEDVTKGQVLARLDTSDYLTVLRNLESQLDGALASRNEARLNFERNSELLKSDTISRATYDAAKSSYENAVALASGLEQQIRQARLNLSYTKLQAPFTGSVAATYLKSFEQVQAQQPVLLLEDVSTLDIEVDVPEFMYVLYKNYEDLLSLPVPVARFEAFQGREFPLTLKEVQTTPNPRTGTYLVTFSMEKPQDLSLSSGMTAEVQMTLPPTVTSQGVVVPINAVFGGEGQSKFVWVLSDTMTTHKRAVEVGEMRGRFIVLTDGVATGEKVVTAGVHYLQEGQKVRILEGKIGGR